VEHLPGPLPWVGSVGDLAMRSLSRNCAASRAYAAVMTEVKRGLGRDETDKGSHSPRCRPGDRTPAGTEPGHFIRSRPSADRAPKTAIRAKQTLFGAREPSDHLKIVVAASAEAPIICFSPSRPPRSLFSFENRLRGPREGRVHLFLAFSGVEGSSPQGRVAIPRRGAGAR